MKLLALIGVALVSTTSASTITVGADGTFATIQAAINAAIAAGGSNQVQVEAGTYNENLTLTQASGSLDVLGGWNSAFSQRNLDPSATQIFGGVVSRVLNASIVGGQFTFSGFSFIGGTATDRGGGVYLHIANTGLAQIRNSRFVFNTVSAASGGNALGGAFYAELFNTGDLIFDGNVVDSNSATVANGVADGGGVFIEAFDSSDAALSNCIIQNNVSAATNASGLARAGGAELAIAGNALVTVNRTRFLANSLQASDLNHASFSGAFVSGSCNGNCEFDLSQSTFDSNHGFIAMQLAVAMGGVGSPLVSLSNSQVSRGSGGGVQLQMDSGTAHVINLTVADNAGTGIDLVPNAPITLFNSLAFGNSADLVEAGPGATLGNNMSGVDPLFVDAAHGNYHVQFNSAARDAATATPPGGLGLFDLDGNPRTFGPAPDIGAFEIGDRIFKDGFQ
jgi:hypothetical protein